jgi:hypothetical protein
VIFVAEKKRFLLRMDPKVYDALEKWAEDEFRSVNAQIEVIIKKALKDAGRLKKAGNSNPKEED